MNESSPWQRRLRKAVGLPTDWNQWPSELRNLPADLEASSLTVPFSLPLLAGARRRRERQGSRVLIGLNGPVGAGKSTLAQQLLRLAPLFDLSLAVASIDDLYRPLAERRRILADNPFGVSRVPPGSHDVPLLRQAIETWRRNGHLRLPRFNKTLADGEGERDGWNDSEADVLVLEGWLIGCRALPDAALHRVLNPTEERDASALQRSAAQRPAIFRETNQEASSDRTSDGGRESWLTLRENEKSWLPHWNTSLRDYEPLWDELDALWILRPTHWTLPRRWRLQAEARQRRAGGGWLGARDLDSLVRSSLTSLPPALYQDPLLTAAGSRVGISGSDTVPGAEAVAILDGQRRCRWCGLATDWPFRTPEADQLSADSASSATG